MRNHLECIYVAFLVRIMHYFWMHAVCVSVEKHEIILHLISWAVGWDWRCEVCLEYPFLPRSTWPELTLTCITMGTDQHRTRHRKKEVISHHHTFLVLFSTRQLQTEKPDSAEWCFNLKNKMLHKMIILSFLLQKFGDFLSLLVIF